MPLRHATWAVITIASSGLLAPPATAQQTHRDNDPTAVKHAASTLVLIEHCAKVDALLRRTCGRIGTDSPPRIREHCDGLPFETFESRTAQLRRAFRDANRLALAAAEPELARQRAEAARLFERDNAHLLTPGTFSGMDLFRLRQEVDGACRRSERLLVPRHESPLPAAPASR
jgi:hypothetical protein